jgi:hypothetical protein
MVSAFTPASQPADLDAVVFFAFAAMIAHSLTYRLSGGGFGSIVFVPLLSCAAVAPGLPGVIGTAIAVLLGEYFRQRDAIRVLFNTAQLTIAVGLAMLVYGGAGGEPLTPAGLGNLAPFVAAFATYFVSNAVLFSGVVSVSSNERFGRRRARLRSHWHPNRLWFCLRLRSSWLGVERCAPTAIVCGSPDVQGES